jgi:hypothetical protein
MKSVVFHASCLGRRFHFQSAFQIDIRFRFKELFGADQGVQWTRFPAFRPPISFAQQNIRGNDTIGEADAVHFLSQLQKANMKTEDNIKWSVETHINLKSYLKRVTPAANAAAANWLQDTPKSMYAKNV